VKWVIFWLLTTVLGLLIGIIWLRVLLKPVNKLRTSQGLPEVPKAAHWKRGLIMLAIASPLGSLLAVWIIRYSA
jgi:hypothetical protein